MHAAVGGDAKPVASRRGRSNAPAAATRRLVPATSCEFLYRLENSPNVLYHSGALRPLLCGVKTLRQRICQLSGDKLE